MDIEYLKSSIGGYMSQALREVAVRRPERPIEWLAYHFISLHEKELQLNRERKKKSESRQKVSTSSSKLLPQVVDKCSKLYVRSSSMVIPVGRVDSERRLTATSLVDEDTYLNEEIAKLLEEVGQDVENRELTAQGHEDMPHAFEVNRLE
ncbi:uncharacterized protein NPIL_126041 [Nephila pilipes]|uniref:RIIa domain-containing protein n=1 Tax=Nephila pilipes TaxID=299642 RepID=A0A8X6MSB6_NEPPI|nr:uncharacterized protein NPIL_126041 [Nephila pilipes]